VLDLSGPTNGLIILTSVSLAITQFFYSNLKTRFADGQSSLKQMFDHDGSLVTESIRKRYDALRTKEFGSVSLQMGLLFVILCICGTLKTLDLLGLWLYGQYSWHAICIPLLALTTFFATLLLIWIAIRLRNLFSIVRTVEQEALECQTNLKVASETVAKAKQDPKVFRTTGEPWDSRR
jgi:hypothetical protein